MKTIDVIILSNTANIEYYRMLSRCIKSIRDNTNIRANIILVESNKKLAGKDLLLDINKVLIPPGEFNYNRFLNYGLLNCNNNFICISNNDVIYHNNCLDTLTTHLSGYDSVSPWDNNSTAKYHTKCGNYEGYGTGSYITGWCIVTKRSTIDKIGGTFDENFSFWCQDDDYSMLLQKNNLKHALISSAEVWHVGGASHSLFSPEENARQTHGMLKVFDSKWKSV